MFIDLCAIIIRERKGRDCSYSSDHIVSPSFHLQGVYKANLYVDTLYLLWRARYYCDKSSFHSTFLRKAFFQFAIIHCYRPTMFIKYKNMVLYLWFKQ